MAALHLISFILYYKREKENNFLSNFFFLLQVLEHWKKKWGPHSKMRDGRPSNWVVALANLSHVGMKGINSLLKF